MKGRTLPNVIDVETSAEAFRREYASGHLGPLEIEKILEFRLDVEIVPIRGLCRRHHSKGYVCASGKRICVDRDIMKSQSEEYRNLLTHETAHISCHPDLLPPPYESLEECRLFLGALSRETRHCMEWEAREWSGRVLIPRTQLRRVFDGVVHAYHAEFVEAFGAEEAHHIFGGLIVEIVSEHFGVLPGVAEARIRNDRLWLELGRVTKRAKLFRRKSVG
jgi:hypothetical protein